MNRLPEQAIEEYLDQLCSQLGAMPPEAQSETREELRQHLQSLIAMQREPERVIESALRQFGDPFEIGRQIAAEWEEGEWSLSGLPLLQRIQRIREAAALEVEQHSTHLTAVNWIQCALLLFNVYISLVPLGGTPGPHFSQASLDAVRLVLFALYFVVGIIGCGREWRDDVRRSAGTAQGNTRLSNHALRNIVGRTGMSVLIPCAFLLPNQAPLIAGAMFALCFVLLVLGRRERSRRTRLVVSASMGYGLLMGIVICTVNMMALFWFGSDPIFLLLLLPVYYFLGRWFWKRPKAPMSTAPASKMRRGLSLLVGVLAAGIVFSSAVARVLERQRAQHPSTPMELVESWQWNGAYLAGDTDVAFMRSHMPQALPALRYGLRHRNSHVRMETANTIEGLGALARPLLPDIKSRVEEEDDQSVRVYLAMTFGGIGDTSQGTGRFLKAAFHKEPDEEVKTYLAGSLARLTAPRFDAEAWQWLLDSLKPGSSAASSPASWLSGNDTSWERRWAAAYVLQEMGAAARPALPALKQLRDDSATPSWVKHKLEQAIQEIQ
jgi:hypothetical protein